MASPDPNQFRTNWRWNDWVWIPDFWMAWPVWIRWLLAVWIAVAVGIGFPVLGAGMGDGGRDLVLVAVGGFSGILAVLVSPLVPLAGWLATLYHADLGWASWPVSAGQASGALFLWSVLAAVLAGRRLALLDHPLIWSIVALSLMLAWSGLTSLDRATGWALAPYPLFYGLVAWGVACTLRRPEDWRGLAWIVVVLTAGHAFPGLVQATSRGTLEAALAGEFSYRIRIQGTAANPIVFGWNMIYGVPAALYLATVERHPLLKVVALGLGLFGLGVSLLTLNRQGFVLAAIAMGATVLLGPTKYRRWLAGGAALAVGAGTVLLLPVMVERLMAAFQADRGGASGGLFRDPSFLERRDAFLTGMNGLAAHPWNGIGLGAFPTTWRDFYPRDGSTYFIQSTLEVEWRYLDSGYVQILVETGLLGFGVAGFVLGNLAWRVWRVRREMLGRGDWEGVAAAGWVLGLGCFVAVGTLVQDTMLNPRVWVLVGMAAALVRMAKLRRVPEG